jgi:hypothetical protein
MSSATYPQVFVSFSCRVLVAWSCRTSLSLIVFARVLLCDKTRPFWYGRFMFSLEFSKWWGR